MPCAQYRYKDKMVIVHMNINMEKGFVISHEILVTWVASMYC